MRLLCQSAANCQQLFRLLEASNSVLRGGVVQQVLAFDPGGSLKPRHVQRNPD